MEITTADVAERLSISERMVRNLVVHGQLSGRQLSDRTWLIDSASLTDYSRRRAGSGRGWSARTSWALLCALSGATAAGIPERTAARIRQRLRESPADEIARKVAKRTRVHHFDTDDPHALASDMVLTGRSAASELDTDLVGQTRYVEGYVRSGQTLSELIGKHHLVPSERGNALIHDPADTQCSQSGRFALPSVIAADLAVSSDSRERQAGLDSLERMIDQWLARPTR